MLLGVTLLKKKYPLAKYLCVLLIVAGVALFMYKPKKVVGVEEHTVGLGELLLVCSPFGKAAFSSRFHQGQPQLRQAENQGRVCCPLSPVAGLCCKDPGSAMTTVRRLKYLAVA